MSLGGRRRSRDNELYKIAIEHIILSSLAKPAINTTAKPLPLFRA